MMMIIIIIIIIRTRFILLKHQLRLDLPPLVQAALVPLLPPLDPIGDTANIDLTQERGYSCIHVMLFYIFVVFDYK
jgi:hypothetical protein